MPWSNQSGGGGWKGGGNGPWGQPPRGGGNNNPPDLEELLRRSQDRLKRVLPGGGGGRGGAGGSGSGGRAAVPLVLAAIAGFWLYESIYVVQPDEVGVELRFGEVKPEINEPGIHFMFWPIESVEKPAVLSEKQENIGGGGTRDNSIMLSGDQNLVDVEFSVLWRIADPVQYLFNVAEQQQLVRVVSESSMREYVGRTRADEFRTTGRDSAQIAVRDLIQQTLDTYRAGITINAVNIRRADPPREVSDAFGEVQRAQQDQDKFRQDAQAYANQRLGDARGEASQIREAAFGYRDQAIAQATGAAQRFRDVYAEYAKSPEITRKRLYLETMEGVLAGSSKVIMNEGAGEGVVPYLPLNELQRPQAPAAGQGGTR